MDEPFAAAAPDAAAGPAAHVPACPHEDGFLKVLRLRTNASIDATPNVRGLAGVHAASIAKFAPTMCQKTKKKAKGQLNYVLGPLVDFKGACQCSDARAIASPVVDADLHKVPWMCEIWQTTWVPAPERCSLRGVVLRDL